MELIILPLRCPHCGGENDLSRIPQEGTAFRCEKCGKLFELQAVSSAGPEASSAPAASKPPRKEESDAQDAARNLAQDYFSDIDLSSFAEEGAAPAKKPAEAKPAPEKTRAAMGEEISEEELRRQREQLFHLVQQSAPASGGEQRAPETHAMSHHKRFARERRGQGIVYWILLALLLLIPAVRVYLGRTTASIEQFSWMQPQIVPSFLYLIAALILLFHLLRRTTRPKWFFAVLLLIPLVWDCWYLIPALYNQVSRELLMSVGGALRIAVAALGIIMSARAKKHPALKYKEAISDD